MTNNFPITTSPIKNTIHSEIESISIMRDIHPEMLAYYEGMGYKIISDMMQSSIYLYETYFDIYKDGEETEQIALITSDNAVFYYWNAPGNWMKISEAEMLRLIRLKAFL
jgi:hypothetical protein